MAKRRILTIAGSLVSVLFGLTLTAGAQSPAFRNDTQHGALHVLVGGKEAFVYRYAATEDLVHYWPVRSPSGRSMTVQHPQPYPHHRSFWFADTVRLKGHRRVSFYNALYSRKKGQKRPGYPDRIRHVRFTALEAKGDERRICTHILWEMDWDTPVLDEFREVRVKALGEGEYFMDIVFKLQASYGDVDFLSDAVHYAWPYIRVNKTYNVDNGGRIVNSEGRINQKGTNGKVARWVDYSKMIEGSAEGIAIFSHPANPYPHRWLTRDYGCFGPRRPDSMSGKPFSLKKGQTLTQRVGVLVHKGDVRGGKVAERYRLYCEGKL